MQNHQNNLRELRKAKGLLQIDVAQLLGHLNSDRVSDWEKGHAMPSVANLFKLAAIYNVTAEELYRDLKTTTMQDIESKRAAGLSEWQRRTKDIPQIA